jgi:integrase
MGRGVRKPAYVHGFVDRHGKPRFYFRRPGFKHVALPGLPWSPEFMAAHEAAMRGATAPAVEIAARRTIPGTLNALLIAFYASAKFTGLEPITRSTYRGILEAWRAKDGDKRIAALQRHHIEARMASKADTPAAQRNYLRMVRMVLAFAIEQKMRADNPALAIKMPSVKSEGYHTWTEEEIATFEERHPVGTKARLAMAIMLYTSGRRGDAVALGPQHIKADVLTYTQHKNRNSKPVRLSLPVHPELRRVIDATPSAHLTFLVTEYGQPFTDKGFGGWFRKRCDEAGLPQCSAHGLRKACCRRLAEAGCSENVIAAITGHRDMRMVAHYTRAANQAQMARTAISTLIATETRTDIGKPEVQVSQSGRKTI